ncbi:MAG: DUF393 domain-containing protein [Candidatus Nanopelagicales bacterium]
MADRVFLFDGDCAFCSSSARWLTRRVPTDVQIVAWQHTDLDLLGVDVREVEVAVVLAGPAGSTSGAAAIAELLLASDGRTWRLAGRALGLPLVRPVARAVYRWVAANRHRLPGGTPECALPR